jgi:phosphatidate cytidylyltransferase
VLKQRVATALVLIPLALAGIFLLPVHYFALFVGAVMVLASTEWLALSSCSTQSWAKTLFALVTGVAIAGFGLIEPVASLSLSLLSIAIAVWLMALYWVLRYPEEGAWSFKPVRLVIGLILFVSTWLSLVGIKSLSFGDGWLLLLCLIVWGADSGAYFAGKRFGKTKLAPNVSPGKTREGLIGGLATVVLITLIFSRFNELSGVATVYLLILAVLTSLVSVLGDLFESLLKRHTGLKDSGNLLPGHGGVLDRIDSLLAATPLFYLGLLMMPII